MVTSLQLQSAIDQLEEFHGKPKVPNFAGPLEMILWENVVYLADDEKRQVAFDAEVPAVFRP